MTLHDRSPMPFGPHIGKIMSKVPAHWLEEYASTAHDITPEHDAVMHYIHVNRKRLDTILDAQEAYA